MNERNQHDMRDFCIEFPGGGKLVKSVDETGVRILRFFSPGPVTATSPVTELGIADSRVLLNPESSDWHIWLSALFLGLSSS